MIRAPTALYLVKPNKENWHEAKVEQRKSFQPHVQTKVKHVYGQGNVWEKDRRRRLKVQTWNQHLLHNSGPLGEKISVELCNSSCFDWEVLSVDFAWPHQLYWDWADFCAASQIAPSKTDRENKNVLVQDSEQIFHPWAINRQRRLESR